MNRCLAATWARGLLAYVLHETLIRGPLNLCPVVPSGAFLFDDKQQPSPLGWCDRIHEARSRDNASLKKPAAHAAVSH